MTDIVISGTGLYTPPHVVTNEELVKSFNAWAARFNRENANAIERGDVDEVQSSTVEFIEKASGIKQRHVMYKEGLLDIERMMPIILRRTPAELSVCAEMSVEASRQALIAARKQPENVDLVICASSLSERPWPAIAIEVQKTLGCTGSGYDMNVACSSATFAISNAFDALQSGMANCVLVVNPEFSSPIVNYRDRDSHFIFGDVATAVIVERAETASSDSQFRILSRKLKTVFSNNIRTDFSYLTRTELDLTLDRFFEQDQWFIQHGRKVFKELLPIVCDHVMGHLKDSSVEVSDISRMWLHQANINMNLFVAQKILGHVPTQLEAPIVLDEYANTASAGAIVAFHKYHEDLAHGDKGLICSFGAGYSVGSLLVEKIETGAD